MRKWFGISLCIFALGCGKGFKDLEDDSPNAENGEYYATLVPLNKSALWMSGYASIMVSDNQIWVRIRAEGDNHKIAHAQHLHFGSRCPVASDDKNGDGVIDAWEGHAIYGDILVPLDSNLNGRFRGMSEFPIMREQGFYFYSRAASWEKLMKDLRKGLDYPEEMMSSLGDDDKLHLDRRVVVIYGIPEGRRLASTVRTYGGWPTTSTVPVACGELNRLGSEDMRP